MRRDTHMPRQSTPIGIVDMGRSLEPMKCRFVTMVHCVVVMEWGGGIASNQPPIHFETTETSSASVADAACVGGDGAIETLLLYIYKYSVDLSLPAACHHNHNQINDLDQCMACRYRGWLLFSLAIRYAKIVHNISTSPLSQKITNKQTERSFHMLDCA